MDKAILKEALEEVIPSHIEATVKSEINPLKDQIKALDTQIVEMAKAHKFAGETKMDQIAKSTAMFFKGMVRKDKEMMTKAAFLNETTDAEGGYMVPTEFATEVLRVAKEVGFLRRYARIIPMSTDKKDISKIVNGVTVYWTAEGVAYTGSKPTTGIVTLIANKMTALVSGTNELIDDNQTDTEVFNLVRDLIGEAMAEFEDTQAMTGTGTAPQLPGIFTVATAIPTYSMATAGTPTYTDLVKIKNKIPVAYRKTSTNKLCWVFNQDMYSLVEALVDSQGRPLLKESMKRDNDDMLLLGYPIEVVASAPAGKIAFGNWSYYLLGDRKAITFDLGYTAGGWESDVQSMKANQRIAGNISFKDAFVIAS